jgi:hypothetical protein
VPKGRGRKRTKMNSNGPLCRVWRLLWQAFTEDNDDMGYGMGVYSISELS